MLRGFKRSFVGVVVLASLVSACDDSNTTPTTPTPQPKTETFIGIVTESGARTHSFDVGATGRVTATLKTVGPDSALVIGFAIGDWNSTSSSCTIVKANDAATVGAVLDGTMTNPGALCIRLYDVGNITTTPATYSVEVVHP